MGPHSAQVRSGIHKKVATSDQTVSSRPPRNWNTAYFICTASSPDTYIQKTKKSYIDSRARRNLGSINTELQDVQRIMVANIEEVLQRGEALSGKSALSQVCSVSFSH